MSITLRAPSGGRAVVPEKMAAALMLKGFSPIEEAPPAVEVAPPVVEEAPKAPRKRKPRTPPTTN